MRLTQHIYLVGSGEIGISDPDDCHVYLVDGGDEYALIDAGCGTDSSVAAILHNIEHDGLDVRRLTTVLLTHWHSDHSCGALRFRELLGCRVFVPSGERSFIEQGRDDVPPCQVDQSVADGDHIHIGNLTLIAYCVPSHSEASTAYLLNLSGKRVLFTGDIVFVNGIIGLINYPGSDLALYRQNLGKLADLSVDALLPGHLLFTLGNGQRHIDLAITRVTTSQFVPYSIGQLGISFIPKYGFNSH